MTLIRLCASAAALLFLAGCETTGETAAGPSTSAQADGFLATLRTAPADAAAFTAYCNEGLALGARIRADLEARTGPAGIDTDFRTFDDLYGLISGVASDASLVSETNPDEATRAAAEDCAQRVDAFSTEISLSRPIYDRLAAVDVTVGDEALKHVHARTLAAYRRAGVDRDEATRARVMALQNQITETGLAFSRNIRDDRSEVWLPNAAALEGMPADYIAAHPPAADGRVRVTTTYPDVYPILTYATNEATRRAVWTAFRNRAWPAN
ncbi:MAG: peptidase M3, partial [Hyphomonadaceae bacterium]